MPHGPGKTNIAYMFVLNEAKSQKDLREFLNIYCERICDVILKDCHI